MHKDIHGMYNNNSRKHLNVLWALHILLYVIFKTTQDVGFIIMNTSVMWKLRHTKSKKCTQSHKLGSGEPGHHPQKPCVESLL